MPKSVCLCREGCKSALLHFQHRILAPLAYSWFILGHLIEAQSHKLHLIWLQMQDVHVAGSPPPQILQSEEGSQCSKWQC